MANPDAMDQLVDRVVARVQQRLQMTEVTPEPVVHGTWQDQSFARLVAAGADRVGTSGAIPADAGRIAAAIDHTLLKPTSTRADIVKVCEEARRHSFASVCVNSTWIRLVANLLAGSSVKPICVVGFPLGAMNPRAKAFETREAIRCGAKEIDMVLNIGALKSRDLALVFQDIKGIVDAARPSFLDNDVPEDVY